MFGNISENQLCSWRSILDTKITISCIRCSVSFSFLVNVAHFSVLPQAHSSCKKVTLHQTKLESPFFLNGE